MTETCDLDDLVEREGLLYRESTDVQFTGEVTGKQQGKLKDGKKEGPWVGYHDNGQLREKGTFRNGAATSVNPDCMSTTVPYWSSTTALISRFRMSVCSILWLAQVCFIADSRHNVEG